MQVSVLVKDGLDGEETPLLVLPFGGAVRLPEHLRTLRWRELATTSTDDRLFWPAQSRIENDIERAGYSLLAV